MLGLDMSAALAIGAAASADLLALAELLPAGEAGLAATLNEHLSDN